MRENNVLREWIQSTGFTDRFHLLGERQDVPRITAAFDVATLSSVSEGFPNVLGEAMACGIPCVATDVGDSALIVGDMGVVVPPRNPERLAEGIQKLLNLSKEEREKFGKRAREHIKTHYALERIVEMYETLYCKEI